MTPLIAEMVNLVKDKADQWMWFDIYEAWTTSHEIFDHARSLRGLQQKLPFQRCAVVLGDNEEKRTLLMITEALAVRVDKDDPEKKIPVLAFAGVMVDKKDKTQGFVLPLFSVNLDEEAVEKGVTIHFENPDHDKEPVTVQSAKNALVAASFWLERMNTQGMKVYEPIPSKSNPKRIRQGKKPMFDWHTVVLEPRSVKSEYLGGTHSSPRLHDVRGHWVVRGNKKFWRKPHKRGDASKGVIFHDYKLKGEKHDHV